CVCNGMRAARFHAVGRPLQIEDVGKPDLRANDVLIRVKAAGMCYSDIHVLDGVIAADPPVTLGHEIAGIVEEVGSGVTGFGKGDRVLVHFLSPCGKCKRCLQGNGMQCLRLFEREGYGFSDDGGYAEYCRVDAERLIKLPDDLGIEFAATLGCAGITAYHAVKSVARVKMGESVVIYGAGGVGLYALQAARLAGAYTIAVARSEARLRLAESLGADHVVNAKESNLRREVRRLTDGAGADVVFDFVMTDESIRNSMGMLASGGRLVLVGVSNKPITIDPQITVLKEFSLLGSLVGTKDELEELVGLAASKRIRSVANRAFTLDEVNEALTMLRRGEIVGRGYVVP
ncbi:MAG: NAD(P)-dependent alcohol dehydrogenase, partial [Candidatus Nitrosocaldus sp.]|nr:NAD(P)-dependent alcohol dehydrogenase [Candidatus Nitrosocaldus sp.]